MFGFRKSKFRHVFGKPLKRDQCYDNIRITKNSWDSTYCAVNPKYVAIITEAAGGGSFLVLPLAKVGRVQMDTPTVSGHRAAVLDIAWSPHNDDVIASASDDCTIKIWQIPDGGLTKNMTDPEANLVAHTKKVGCIKWHPSALNVLVSGGHDNHIFLWNVGTEEPLKGIDCGSIPYCLTFNYDGSKMACTCKDKKLKIYNPRSGDLIGEKQAHAGSKASIAVYLKDGLIFTTGFSRMSERQYALWNEKDLSSPKVIEEVDNSNGVMFPLYDQDVNMIYVCGKGDSVIRYFEVTEEEPYVHYLETYQSKDSGRGVGFMPKRGLNVNNCEIARIYKLHNGGLCEVIPFTVPRKSELFQSDIYPDTASDTPALTADEWFQGKDANPILMPLQGGFVPSHKEPLKVNRKSNVLDKMPQRQSVGISQPTNSEAAAAAVLPPGFDPQGILDDMRKLKLIVKAHERRIKTLEEKLSNYDVINTSEEDEEKA